VNAPIDQHRWNWARTHEFTAAESHHPSSIDELLSIIGEASGTGTTLHGVGTRHSFTSIADGDAMIDTSQLPEICELGADRSSVRIGGSMIYSRLCELLRKPGLALANLASLPHITIAGAVSTGTHGSGHRVGNLATAVRSVDIATAAGEVQRIDRSNADFAGIPISLGALGIITALELDLVPAFDVEQQVHDSLSWDPVTSTFDLLFSSAYSVSVFTDWRDRVQLWTKRRMDAPAVDHEALHDGSRARATRHPVPGESAEGCTDQESPGLWSERLPHFRAGSTPSVGAEVQSEFFVDRAHAVDAIARLRAVGDDLADALMIAEIRVIRRDNLWLSPQYEQDCVAFHFTWHHDVRAVATALAPLRPRPHWAKVFDRTQFDWSELYPRLPDARRLQRDWDPQGLFRNAWLAAIFPG